MLTRTQTKCVNHQWCSPFVEAVWQWRCSLKITVKNFYSHFFNKYTDLPYLKLSLTPRMELFWENSQGDSSGFKKLGFIEQFFLEFDNTY